MSGVTFAWRDGTFRLFLATLAALAVLNFSLAHQNVWPTPWVRVTADLSLEAAALVFLLAVAAALGRHAGVRLQWALAALVLVFAFGRYVDVTAPALFGRRIDLYWDTQHIPNIAAMVIETWSVLSIVLLFAGIVTGLAILIVILRLCVGVICRAAQNTALRSGLMASSAIVLGVYLAGMNSAALDWERHFAIPITPVYAVQANALAQRMTGTADPNALVAGWPSLRPYAELSGRDAIVIFIESYGRVALDSEAYSDGTRALLARVGEELAEAGWQMRSGYLTAPTFGGASWLSHSSLLAGHEISAHDDYESFLHSSREHIVDRFGRAGYRTILLTPGIRGPWPAGLALRFDRIIDASDVHYPGPGFGWWYIPDQYSLDHLNREELSASDRAPLFAMFPTIMSHFPFGPTPPYLQNWASLSADIPYASGDVERSEALGDAISGDRESAYLRSILYEIEAATGFVQNRAPEKSIIVVLGDHQPPAAISGESANWDVPVHVFARDPALLAPFEGKGAIPGMIPSGATIGRIDELNALLLEALEQPDASLIAVSSRNR